MRKEIAILVLTLFSCRGAFEEIVRALKNVPSYNVSSVAVGDAALLTQWTKTLQDFDALVVIGVEGNEEIFSNIESYEGPVVLVTPLSPEEVKENLEEIGEIGEWHIVNVAHSGSTEEVLHVLQGHWEHKAQD